MSIISCIAQTLSGGNLDYDNNTVALALQTLGSFDFGGKIKHFYTVSSFNSLAVS